MLRMHRGRVVLGVPDTDSDLEAEVFDCVVVSGDR